ncbi:hypothetical protein BGZ95_009810 [Linnemannia exigua]|uniref:HCP-like protein n=1 Tax=Linnemannia exigua TaxID=604196 RepID=A0AAD4H6D0_9FUNG|nr:hypothetical protein BGZ95_009810 [Linnemannia exigua]
MENEPPQVQAVRPVNKDSLASIDDSAPAPNIMYFDCLVDPTTKKGFLLWDDIRLAFSDALYARYQAKVVPFMKGIDFMPLQPLRIAAIPDVVLDVVVDGPMARTEAASPQVLFSQTTDKNSDKVATDLSHTTFQDLTKGPKSQEEAPGGNVHSTTSAIIAEINTTMVGRSPAYGLVEEAMQNYNHIDNPAFGPKPRGPQLIPNSDDDDATDSLAPIYEQLERNGPSIDIKPPQAPQDHTFAAGVKDISPIIIKATLGDIISQVELGNMHKVGDNVEQDYEAARYWYLKAANQGNASAQCSVGDLYRLGLGIEFNHLTALSWYQKAASQGDATGQHNLGFMYQYGLAVEMDYAAAMDWYRKSADQGHAFAQSRIGSLYFHGLGVSQDYSKAMEWLLLAAKQDLSWAHYNLGCLYLHGHGVAMDKDIALEWFQKATVGRDTDVWVQYTMGYLYFKGLGAPQDYSKAREWLLKAASQGCPQAQCFLASSYLLGYGVAQNYSEAMMWLRKAADQHFPQAQLNIGLLYRHGFGVPMDYSIAKEWYAKAALQELPGARRALEELQQSMDKEKEDQKQK